MTKQLMLAGLLALGTVACAGGDAKEVAKSGSAAEPRKPSAPAERSLANGTRVQATIGSALSSRTSKPGETFGATVSSDVMDARGNVAIPAGSAVTLKIEQLEPGSDQVRPEGRISLAVVSMTVRGREYPLNANLEPVTHRLQGRGVTTDEAARVGAGTAIGAIAGQVIGKNTKSTVIGGAIGAVAGGAVAARYALRDVVVDAGTPIVFTLGQSLTIAAK